MKAARFENASSRKLRRLSGWNVFCKQKMEGASSSTEEYTSKMKQISAEWKQLPLEDKQGFEVEAQHQQELRTRLAFTPLSVGSSGKTDLEQQVGRTGCKLLSARRLKINETMYRKHTMWSLPTSLSDGVLPALAKLCGFGFV